MAMLNVSKVELQAGELLLQFYAGNGEWELVDTSLAVVNLVNGDFSSSCMEVGDTR